jgi:hypothetical protein
MGRRSTPLAAALAAVLLTAAPADAQLRVGQRDTFEDGTTQNWIINLLGIGSPPPAALPRLEDGGPGGAGDSYLRLTSVGGGGAGSRLAVLNYGGQWVGDYRAAGISAIRLDARNFGETDLALRLLFENPGLPPTPGPPTALAISAAPLLLPVGGTWTSLTFPLFGAGGLVGLFGSDVDALLRATTMIRLVHMPGPVEGPIPPTVVASLGVDNITAVPEPTTLALVAGGAGLLALTGARRARRGASRRR